MVSYGGSSSNATGRFETEAEYMRAGVLCRHNIPTKLQVRRKGINRGKRFYACSLWQVDNCSFFQWADDEARRAMNVEPSETAGIQASSSRWAGTVQDGFRDNIMDRPIKCEEENKKLKKKVEGLKEMKRCLELKLLTTEATLEALYGARNSKLEARSELGNSRILTISIVALLSALIMAKNFASV